MSPNTQAKILRVLQEHEFERLGGTRTIKVDVRLIAATNRDLPAMVEAGAFREDLYYRLNVVTIEMPPLRERKEDVAALAGFFIRRFAGELKKKIDGLEPDALKLLMRYHWPGNIRELENAIERAMLLADGTHIAIEDLRLGDTGTVGSPRETASVVKIPPTGIPLEEIERLAIVEALKMSNWVQKDAAELLAISPRVMNYKIKTLGIDFPRGRRAALQHHDRTAADRLRLRSSWRGRFGPAPRPIGLQRPWTSAGQLCRFICRPRISQPAMPCVRSSAGDDVNGERPTLLRFARGCALRYTSSSCATFTCV